MGRNKSNKEYPWTIDKEGYLVPEYQSQYCRLFSEFHKRVTDYAQKRKSQGPMPMLVLIRHFSAHVAAQDFDENKAGNTLCPRSWAIVEEDHKKLVDSWRRILVEFQNRDGKPYICKGVEMQEMGEITRPVLDHRSTTDEHSAWIVKKYAELMANNPEFVHKTRARQQKIARWVKEEEANPGTHTKPKKEPQKACRDTKPANTPQKDSDESAANGDGLLPAPPGAIILKFVPDRYQNERFHLTNPRPGTWPQMVAKNWTRQWNHAVEESENGMTEDGLFPRILMGAEHADGEVEVFEERVLQDEYGANQWFWHPTEDQVLILHSESDAAELWQEKRKIEKKEHTGERDGAVASGGDQVQDGTLLEEDPEEIPAFQWASLYDFSL